MCVTRVRRVQYIFIYNSAAPNCNGPNTCECEAGFSGDKCEINADDCTPNPCQNNAVCVDGANAYMCDCANTGYSGANCDTNINECDPNPCQNGGTCVDGINSYTCQCPSGYTDDNCETNIDECADSANNNCHADAKCTDTPGSFTCECNSGFDGDGTDCKDIDECADVKVSNCHVDADCLNTPGTFSCKCKTGFTGDGNTCAACHATCAECSGTSAQDCTECDGGATPINGVCELPDDSVCTSNAVCKNTCVGGKCAPPSSTGKSCDDSDDDDCTAGNQCVGSGPGTCLLNPGETCTDDASVW